MITFISTIVIAITVATFTLLTFGPLLSSPKEKP